MIASRSGWPFPGDGPLARRTKVALAYRELANRVAPEACAQLDAAMRGYGQTWVVPRIQRFEADDWLSVADAADLASIGTDQLRVWRRSGRLVGRLVDGRWKYQAREVLGASTRLRRRTAGAADG